MDPVSGRERPAKPPAPPPAKSPSGPRENVIEKGNTIFLPLGRILVDQVRASSTWGGFFCPVEAQKGDFGCEDPG